MGTRYGERKSTTIPHPITAAAYPIPRSLNCHVRVRRAVQYTTVKYSTVQYVQYSRGTSVQYSTVASGRTALKGWFWSAVQLFLPSYGYYMYFPTRTYFTPPQPPYPPPNPPTTPPPHPPTNHLAGGQNLSASASAASTSAIPPWVAHPPPTRRSGTRHLESVRIHESAGRLVAYVCAR